MGIVRNILVGLALLSASSEASATTTLGDLPAVEHALDGGVSVAVVLDLSLCQPASADSKPTKTRGGRHIDAYRVTEDGSLAFADDHFTIGRDGKPIRQFLRYQVHPDGEADFSMTVFSVPDFQRVGTTLEYKCAINRGMRFVAVHG
ncbi:VirK family protein [Sphingomonas sp. PB2P12]|uniref:VirK family protein n=1 Tax=Sphingomonas sandaracina TaxID=3096157 RepID=UPI002FCBBDA6